MDIFHKFLDHIQHVLHSHKISRDDIRYINLTDDYWINVNDFFALTEAPKVWPHFIKNYIGTWDVPRDFKIVMRNYSWIDYYTNLEDEYYNTFVLHKSPVRAHKRFTASATKNGTPNVD